MRSEKKLPLPVSRQASMKESPRSSKLFFSLSWDHAQLRVVGPLVLLGLLGPSEFLGP